MSLSETDAKATSGEAKVVGNRNMDEILKKRKEPVPLRKVFTKEEIESKEYTLSHSPGSYRGRAIIINNIGKFTDGRRIFLDRKRSKHDGARIYQCLKSLQFDIVVYENIPAAEILEHLNNVALEDHNSYSAFVCVILSLGQDGMVYGTDMGAVALTKMMECFDAQHCPSLILKPKIFIIQACEPIEAIQTDGGSEKSVQPVAFKIPTHTDFVVIFSTYPIFRCNLDKGKPSHFIGAVCDYLDEEQKELDFLRCLTRVNRTFYDNATADSPGRKVKVPLVLSTLTKSIYFKS